MFRKCGIYDEWFLGVPLAFNNYNESNQEFQHGGKFYIKFSHVPLYIKLLKDNHLKADFLIS